MSFYKGGIMKKQNNKIAIINFGNFIDFYKNDIVKLCKKYKSAHWLMLVVLCVKIKSCFLIGFFAQKD